MRARLIAPIAACVVAVGAQVAYAHPNYDYVGGCGLSVVHDGTSNPQTEWTGHVQVTVAVTDTGGVPAPMVPVTASCEMYVDGMFAQVLIRSDGVGAVADVAPVTYQAHPDATVVLCDSVTAGDDAHTDCAVVQTGAPGVPRPVVDAVTTVADTALAAYEDVRRARREVYAAAAPLDPVLDEVPGIPLRSWVDGIHIVANQLGEAHAVYEGAFAVPALWECDEFLYETAPRVVCEATSLQTWECGLMHAQAEALTYTDPDRPGMPYWGAAAAYVSCDGHELTTPRADRNQPITYGQELMGPVTVIVCRAQYGPGSTGAPSGPYHVTCVDPPYVR